MESKERRSKSSFFRCCCVSRLLSERCRRSCQKRCGVARFAVSHPQTRYRSSHTLHKTRRKTSRLLYCCSSPPGRRRFWSGAAPKLFASLPNWFFLSDGVDIYAPSLFVPQVTCTVSGLAIFPHVSNYQLAFALVGRHQALLRAERLASASTPADSAKVQPSAWRSLSGESLTPSVGGG